MDRFIWDGEVAFLRVRTTSAKPGEKWKRALANVSKPLYLKRKCMPGKV